MCVVIEYERGEGEWSWLDINKDLESAKVNIQGMMKQCTKDKIAIKAWVYKPLWRDNGGWYKGFVARDGNKKDILYYCTNECDIKE